MRLAVIVLLFAASPCMAFDFKGLRLGEATTKDAVETATGLRCGAGINNILVCNGETTIATIPARCFLNLDANGVLYRISLTFKSSGWPVVFSALKDKFGAPSDLSETEVSNALGARFLDIRATWTNSAGDILAARRYSGNITDSHVAFLSKPYIELERANRPDPRKDL